MATVNVTSFKTKLDFLGCPFIENSTEEVVKELLFSPGEHRIRMLQWLFGKIDGQIYNHIEKQPKYMASNEDWRWNNMLSASIALGLASRSDMDVIAGIATEDKQAAFYERLLNVAVIMDRVEAADYNSSQTTLKEQYLRDTAFITQAVSENVKKNAFPTTISVMPMDLNRLVQENWKEKAWKPSDPRPPIPDKKHLVKQVTDLQTRLDKEREAFSEIKNTCSVSSFTADTTDETTKSCIRSRYSLVLNGLFQILTDFSYCFANDMEVWCSGNKKGLDIENILPSQDNELAPLIRQTYRLMKGLFLLVQDLKSLATLPGELRSCSQLDVIESKVKSLEEIRKNFEYCKVIFRERKLEDD